MANHPEIPYGFYCYEIVRIEEARLVVNTCPYWKCDPTKPDQDNGVCELLNINDWENGTMLWDQVKECNENLFLDE